MWGGVDAQDVHSLRILGFSATMLHSDQATAYEFTKGSLDARMNREVLVKNALHVSEAGHLEATRELWNI